MTKEQAIEKLKKLQEMIDTERAHGEADDVLCAFLVSLGFKDVVDEFEAISKWYA